LWISKVRLPVQAGRCYAYREGALPPPEKDPQVDTGRYRASGVARSNKSEQRRSLIDDSREAFKAMMFARSLPHQ
jgi:hypothetical protein